MLICLLKFLYISCLAIENQNAFLSLKKHYIVFENLPFYNKSILQNPLFFKTLNRFFINFIILLKTFLFKLIILL